MNYHFDRERDRMKEQLELAVRDLGQSMIDSLKWRDAQIDQKLKSINACITPHRLFPIALPHIQLLKIKLIVYRTFPQYVQKVILPCITILQ